VVELRLPRVLLLLLLLLQRVMLPWVARVLLARRTVHGLTWPWSLPWPSWTSLPQSRSSRRRTTVARVTTTSVVRGVERGSRRSWVAPIRGALVSSVLRRRRRVLWRGRTVDAAVLPVLRLAVRSTLVAALLLRVPLVRRVVARWRCWSCRSWRRLIHGTIPLRETLRRVVKIRQPRVAVDRGHPPFWQRGSTATRRALLNWSCWSCDGNGCGNGRRWLLPLRQAEGWVAVVRVPRRRVDSRDPPVRQRVLRQHLRCRLLLLVRRRPTAVLLLLPLLPRVRAGL
jgi:hypothetical protein